MEIKMELIHPGGGRQDENENEDGCIMKRCTTQAGPSFVFEPDDLLFTLI